MSCRRGERGATLVEAAVILPVLIMLLLGIFDLADWNLQRSQASSAARDGARAAIVSATGADTVGSTANNAVQSAIAARLGGKSFSYTVSCLPATGTTTTACIASSQTVDRYRVKVTVTWSRPAATFISAWFGTSTITGSSIMTIDG